MKNLLLVSIIILTLAVTSGAGAYPNGDERLSEVLQEYHAEKVQGEITAWYPLKDNGSGQRELLASTNNYPGIKVRSYAIKAETRMFIKEKYLLPNASTSLSLYNNIRREALNRGGGANLKLRAAVPYSGKNNRILGENILRSLGAGQIVQAIEEGQLFSAAAFIQGWGERVSVGNDEINLQIIVRPGENKTVQLFILAPDLLNEDV